MPDQHTDKHVTCPFIDTDRSYGEQPPTDRQVVSGEIMKQTQFS
jgi:hypothetical protein